MFFFRACIKEDIVLKRLMLGFIFGPKKDKLFCLVLVFRRGMSNAICVLVVYLQSEDLNISWIYPGTSSFQDLKLLFERNYSTLSLAGSEFIFLKWDESIWDIGDKFRQKWIHLFWAFWGLIFKFFFKRRHHEKHPYSKSGWINALHNSLL